MKKLKYFFKYNIPFVGHWNHIHNPYYPWYKARKYFKRPRCKVTIGKKEWFYGFPFDCWLNKIIDIRFSSLGWKDKYDSPRHEWNPYIAITFFNKWWIVFTFGYFDYDTSTRNDATYEAMLDYLFYDIPLDELVGRHTWEKSTGEKITIERNLKYGSKSN